MKEGKIRKFADNQAKNRQTDVSTTESTLILSGSSPDTRGSWPIRKFAYKMEQTIRQSDGSKTETTLSLSSVDTRGSWPI